MQVFHGFVRKKSNYASYIAFYDSFGISREFIKPQRVKMDAKRNPQIPTIIMNAILLLVTIFFTCMAITSCTTKEGEDLDVLTPEDEDQLGREQL